MRFLKGEDGKGIIVDKSKGENVILKPGVVEALSCKA